MRLNVSEDSRIGIILVDFDEAVSIAKNVCLKISGLHFHRGTGTNATSALTDMTDNVLETAQKLLYWQYIDLSGSFGYPYHHQGATFNWEIFGYELSRGIIDLKEHIDLIIEPGRAAISGCPTLLAKVVSLGKEENKLLVLILLWLTSLFLLYMVVTEK